MSKRCQLLVFLLQGLLTNCRLVPSARPKGVPRLHITKLTTLHPLTTTQRIDVRQVGNFFDPMSKDNSEFCSAMATEPIDYPITPWWYRYCIDVIQNKKEKLKDQVNVAAIKQYMMEEMNAYKKLENMESRKNMNNNFNKNNIRNNNRNNKLNNRNNKL